MEKLKVVLDWFPNTNHIGFLIAQKRGWFAEAGLDYTAALPHLVYQTACGVAREALELVRTGGLVSAGALSPQYHRLSQAERERMEREKKL